MTTRTRRYLLGATAVLGAFVGVWAAFLPSSFYLSFPGLGLGPWISIDGPFNEHLIRDVGALNLALAAAATGAAVTGSVAASRAVGIGWIVYSVPHLIYHLHHLAGLAGFPLIVEIVSLGSTVVLGLAMLTGPRRVHPRNPIDPTPTEEFSS